MIRLKLTMNSHETNYPPTGYLHRQIRAHEMLVALGLMQPGTVSRMEISHDHDCPILHGKPRCNCKPDMTCHLIGPDGRCLRRIPIDDHGNPNSVLTNKNNIKQKYMNANNDTMSLGFNLLAQGSWEAKV